MKLFPAQSPYSSKFLMFAEACQCFPLALKFGMRQRLLKAASRTSSPHKTISNLILHILGAAVVLCAVASGPAKALEMLDDSEMSVVNGAGVALAFDNFSSRLAPTSYIGVLGTDLTVRTAADCTSNPNDAYCAPHNYRRGDLYYYGLSMTGGSLTDGMDWYGTGQLDGGCTPGADGLGCPMGRTASSAQVQGIKNWASVYNPYMIRVFQYAGYSYEGVCLGTEVAGKCSQVAVSGANASPTYYEFLGPSKGDKWRWAFWGELLVNNGSLALGANGANFTGTCNAGAAGTVAGNCAGILKSQAIILGNNFTLDNKPTRLQLAQTPTSVVDEQSLSLIYQSRLSGDFRFSVAQKTGTTGVELHGAVPDFNDVEGLYFKNVDAFMALGQNNYQSMVFRNNGTTGNFIIELTPISSNSNVANTFYCGQKDCASFLTSTIPAAYGGVALNGSDATIGCVNQSGAVVGCSGATLRSAGTGVYNATTNPNGARTCAPATWTSVCTTAETIVNPANANPDSHGYIYWGTPAETRSGVTGVAAPGATDTNNGIYFRDPDGAVTNIGRAKVNGMMLQMLKITSLGVGG